MMLSRWASVGVGQVGLAIHLYPTPAERPTAYAVLDKSDRYLQNELHTARERITIPSRLNLLTSGLPPSYDMELTIALVQMRIAFMDPLRNLERMEAFVEKAKRQGADLVVFPEDAVCGPLEGQTAFVQYAPDYLARMQALAVRHAIDLAPGSWTVPDQGLLYNQAHYIDASGTLRGTYRKVNLWETERAHITPGIAASVFPTRFGNVGLTICWDISFPAMFAAMNAQGAELVISPTYWSFPRKAVLSDEVLLIDSLCTTRAFENNILFAYCNAAGQLKHSGVANILSGRSQLTHPLDKVVCKAEGNKEEMLVARTKLIRTVPAIAG